MIVHSEMLYGHLNLYEVKKGEVIGEMLIAVVWGLVKEMHMIKTFSSQGSFIRHQAVASLCL